MPSSACKTSALDRKSTRLNSSHTLISYAVFCLTKKILEKHQVLPLFLVEKVLTFAVSEPANVFLFFFNDPATTEIYPLSLPDALPICLNSSHTLISYAVFCLRDESVTGVQ